MMDPAFRKESRWNSGKKVHYSCLLIFNSKKTEMSTSLNARQSLGKRSFRPDVIILEENNHDEIVKTDTQDDIERQALVTSSCEEIHLPSSFSSEMKTKVTPSTLHAMSTESMRRSAHRILVRRIFIVELSCWALIYIILTLWARRVQL